MSPDTFCDWICAARDDVSFMELQYSVFDNFVGFIIPRPPSLGGNANRSLSTSVQLCPFVIAGTNTFVIASSSGCSIVSIWGIVLDKYVHLCLRPKVKAV